MCVRKRKEEGIGVDIDFLLIFDVIFVLVVVACMHMYAFACNPVYRDSHTKMMYVDDVAVARLYL